MLPTVNNCILVAHFFALEKNVNVLIKSQVKECAKFELILIISKITINFKNTAHVKTICAKVNNNK